MAKQTINIGASPNDGTGTPLRTAFDYTNQNFTELYTATGPSGNNIVVPGSATITGDLTVDTSTLKVDSANNVVGITNASPLTGTDGGLTVGVIGSSKALAISMFNCFARLRERDAINNFAITTNIDTTNAVLDDNTRSSWKVRLGSGSDNFLIQRAAIGSTTFQDLYSVSTSSAIWSDGAGGTRMTLNSTGLGVGVVPSAWQSNFKAFELGRVGNAIATYTAAGGAADLYISSNAYYNGGFKYANSSQTAGLYSVTGNVHAWFTAASGTAGATITDFATAKMTLDASGNLLVNATSTIGSAKLLVAQTGNNNGIYVSGSFDTPLINFSGAGFFRSDGAYLSLQTNSAGGVIYITPNTGGVYISPGNTSWTANSDERLKDIIEPIGNAVSKVKSLRSVIGKWKTDPDGTRRSFLIAQDVQAVFPEVIDTNADGMLGIKYSEVIPLLVAAIKELSAEVNALKNA
jgi:hypothetical protein